MATSPPAKSKSTTRETRLPSLFATETQLFGWQGLTATIPVSWNLASFGGTAEKGHLRIDDDDRPRLELRWEQPAHDVDLERSVSKFLDIISRQAKKKGERFEIADEPRFISRSKKRKAKLITFGWTGDRSSPVGQGWGVVWLCADCGRVVVGHVMGCGTDSSDSLQRLAGEVFSSLECHGCGGWQTWSIFNLRVEIPEEFKLAQAKLMTGRLEIEWRRTHKHMLPWLQRDESLVLTRVALADVLLENTDLAGWANGALARTGKRWVFPKFEDATLHLHEGLLAEGKLRDLKLRLRMAALDLVSRKRAPRAELRVWNCRPSNRIYSLLSDVKVANHHVVGDLLDSLECHI